MSEYQYYEFLALDQALTPKQIAAVRRFSSRAEITPTSFVNEYDYGDFRGDVDDFLIKYFDLHVYLANWGTHRFAMALPAEAADAEEIIDYCTDETVHVNTKGGRLLIDKGALDRFKQRLNALRESHRAKSTFIRRLRTVEK
jgi:hypothetical protein